MKTIILFAILLLTGCSSGFRAIANFYDANDICQTREFAQDGTRLKAHNYQQPQGCSGSRQVQAVIRNNQGQQIGVITNR